MEAREQLAIISKAWGKQDGYCFFPWIPGDAEDKRARIKGYHEGPAFHWPSDRQRIVEHLEAHTDDDVYWCPNLFEQPRRQAEVAMDEHALWADLDEVDPNKVDSHLRPTIAWETSPGRFQGLWLLQNGFLQNASWPGFENQRLTYYLGADNSGWDTTQLLRIPGWANHKPERREANGGKPWQGRLLWKTGPRYLPDHFTDLPEVEQITHVVDTLVDAELGNIDRHKVWARVRLKIAPHIREQFRATEAAEGSRSEVLWQMARELADAGCTATEIVALIRPTVWNKYVGRGDELKRLTIEASKALAEASAKAHSGEGDGLEVYGDQIERPDSIPRIADFLRDIKPPDWLIQNIWAKGSCGFLAGQPKSYKSWTGLDMALSVATGNEFLGVFKVMDPGPVLYIQEEDSGPMLKKRFGVMLNSRAHMESGDVNDDGILTLTPKDNFQADPDVHIMLGHSFVISDEGWQSWLDEALDRQAQVNPYRMLMLDPMMMIQGDVEENRAAAMTEKVFKPLKVLARKYGLAIAVIHHMRKGDGNGQRGGQMMLGSVANHAWTEDSLYLTKLKHGEVGVEVESKHAQGGSFKIRKLRNKQWTPEIYDNDLNETEDKPEDVEVIKVPTPQERQRHRRRSKPSTASRAKLLRCMQTLGGRDLTTAQVATAMKITPSGARAQLNRAVDRDQVRKNGSRWSLI